jgi:hypothetical protein
MAKKQYPALKHAGYCAMSVLPGESAAEFEKLHQELIAELIPNGVLEEEIVATIAHLVWRSRHVDTFRIAERARKRMAQIRDPLISHADDDETFTEQWNAAENQVREELGELYSLVEMGDEATLEGLDRSLAIQERLDSMIDKCLKRLLFVRGLKSISTASSSPPRERLA